jgi:DNA-directed RNA polymerase subunit RPC12/RpoP
MFLFLPFSPDEVMKEVDSILQSQRREKKPSAWVFNECIAWEDRNRFQIIPVYGDFYHISTQARRLSENEIDAGSMRADLQNLFGRYWSAPRIMQRIGVGTLRILGIGSLFLLVGLAHVALSAWLGNVPAAAIIIGILLAVVLIPQAVREIWGWIRKRNDEQSVVYQQSILQRLGGMFTSRCPKCGKYLGNMQPEEDGYIHCECGYRKEVKPGS